jgi:hypothetical protein
MYFRITKALLMCSATLPVLATPAFGSPKLVDQADGSQADNEMGRVPIFVPGAKAFGKKMSRWSADWWRYILSIPQTPNPLLDPNGEYCTLAQHGPVWFLEGVRVGAAAGGEGYAERIATLPEGKALVFPLINLVNINVTDQPVEELRAEIADCMDGVTDLFLEIDGTALPSRWLRRSRVQSVPFEVTYPEDGVPFDHPTPAAIYSPAVDDGYYVMLRPLPVGEHTLHFGGASPGCTYAPTGSHVAPSSVDITYHLTVDPVTLH